MKQQLNGQFVMNKMGDYFEQQLNGQFVMNKMGDYFELMKMILLKLH